MSSSNPEHDRAQASALSEAQVRFASIVGQLLAEMWAAESANSRASTCQNPVPSRASALDTE